MTIDSDWRVSEFFSFDRPITSKLTTYVNTCFTKARGELGSVGLQ